MNAPCPACNRNPVPVDFTACVGCREAMARRFGPRFGNEGETLADLMLAYNDREYDESIRVGRQRLAAEGKDVDLMLAEANLPPARAIAPGELGAIEDRLRAALERLDAPAVAWVEDWEEDWNGEDGMAGCPFLVARLHDDDGSVYMAPQTHEDVIEFADCVNAHEYDMDGNPF